MIFKCLLAVLVPSLVSTGRVPGPDERIIGGYGIPIEEAPYQVAILLKDVQWCGGVIYSERIVLTAAHCFNRTLAKDYSVRVGSSFPNHGGQVVPVQEAFPHENFTAQKIGASNDIALFYLREPLKLNTPRTQTIKLAEKSPETGSNCRVTGWGYTFPGSNMAAPNLLATDLKIADFNNCREVYLGNVTTNMICATAPGKDSCKGDSGGPLISFPDRKLIGIVSFGIGCAKPGYPGVYTSVAHFRDWIRNTINKILESQNHSGKGK